MYILKIEMPISSAISDSLNIVNRFAAVGQPEPENERKTFGYEPRATRRLAAAIPIRRKKQGIIIFE